MTFLSPAILGGLLLGAVPIIIHLLSRRRPTPVQFAATEFVQRTIRRVMRRVRLKQLILLILRTLALIFAVLALARPAVRSRGVAVAQTNQPSATVIVLDASYSMHFRHDGRTLFEKGMSEAVDLLDSLTAEDTAAVLLAGASAEVLGDGLTPGFDSLIRELQGAKPSWARGDLPEALNVAEGLLKTSEQPVKRIYLISDFTAGSLELSAVPAPPAAGRDVALGLIDVAEDADDEGWLPNASVTELGLQPAPDLAPRTWRVNFTTRNQAGEALEARGAALFRDEKAYSRVTVDAGAGEDAGRSFTHTFDELGAKHVRVQLDPDALTADDIRHGVVQVHDDLRVLIADGDPRMGSYLDEVYYLERALRPGTVGAGGLRARIVSADDLGGTRLEDFQVVVLANVRAVGDNAAAALKRFVQEGGGLFISMGDRVEAEAYNNAFGGALPMSLWDTKVVARRDDPDAAVRAVTFNTIDTIHPVLQVFDGAQASVLKATMTYAFRLMRPHSRGDDAQVLLQFSDGSPALVERSVGKGKVMLLATSVDRDWSDLCIKTAFLPLMQQSVRYLTGSLSAAGAKESLVGQRQAIRIKRGVDRIRVEGPEGNEEVTVPEELGANTGERLFEYGGPQDRGLMTPGTYRVSQELSGRFTPTPDQDFAVNVDPREGDTRRVDPEEVSARWGGTSGGADALTAQKLGGGSGRKIWSALLAGLVLLLFAESVLTRRT